MAAALALLATGTILVGRKGDWGETNYVGEIAVGLQYRMPGVDQKIGV